MNRRFFLSSSIALGSVAALSRLPILSASPFQGSNTDHAASKGIKKIMKTDAEWKRILTPDQFEVTRHQGTERPFSSPLNEIHEQGTFRMRVL